MFLDRSGLRPVAQWVDDKAEGRCLNGVIAVMEAKGPGVVRGGQPVTGQAQEFLMTAFLTNARLQLIVRRP